MSEETYFCLRPQDPSQLSQRKQKHKWMELARWRSIFRSPRLRRSSSPCSRSKTSCSERILCLLASDARSRDRLTRLLGGPFVVIGTSSLVEKGETAIEITERSRAHPCVVRGQRVLLCGNKCAAVAHVSMPVMATHKRAE